MKKPNVYQRAARELEQGKTRYPCFAVAEETGNAYYIWEQVKECRDFLSIFCDEVTPHEQSITFISEIHGWTKEEFVENSIVALCFAGAMLDAGDLS